MERQKLFNERPYTKFTQYIKKSVMLLDVHKKNTNPLGVYINKIPYLKMV